MSMSEDRVPYGEPLKFSCLVDSHRVELRQIGASGSGWRCSCRAFSRPREGDPPSCEHIELAFKVWYKEHNSMPDRITEATWQQRSN
jgi:hypothetical protein